MAVTTRKNITLRRPRLSINKENLGRKISCYSIRAECSLKNSSVLGFKAGGEVKKRYGLCVLNYIVTSNHVHLLIVDTEKDVIAKSLQFVAGRTAQECCPYLHQGELHT
jgi:hypothetical protein